MKSREWLLENLDYDPETGALKWKTWSPGRRYDRAGSLHSNGYVIVIIDGKRMLGHRIAWTIANGEIPRGMEIDHKNGNPSDNSISNLRIATRSQNARNGRMRKNATGFRGVYITGNGKFQAMASLNGKLKALGTFETAEAAHEAYLKAIRSDEFRTENSR